VIRKVEYSTLPDKELRVRCSRCKAKFSLQKVFKDEGKANCFNAVVVASGGGANDIVSLYTNDTGELLVWLRDLEVEVNRLSDYKSSLIASKVALENTANELSRTKAKLRMLEGEVRDIRMMSWWKRLFWR
jgi:hypothetical protein